MLPCLLNETYKVLLVGDHLQCTMNFTNLIKPINKSVNWFNVYKIAFYTDICSV